MFAQLEFDGTAIVTSGALTATGSTVPWTVLQAATIALIGAANVGSPNHCCVNLAVTCSPKKERSTQVAPMRLFACSSVIACDRCLYGDKVSHRFLSVSASISTKLQTSLRFWERLQGLLLASTII